MRLLLDTHVLLAIIHKTIRKLPQPTQFLLPDPAHEFSTSVASLWEIAIKWRLGKLTLTPALDDLPALCAASGIALLSIKPRHVLALVDPEPLTRDPFDRLLLAHCQVDGLRLITVDRALVSHGLAAHRPPGR